MPRNRRIASSQAETPPFSQIVRLWVLRILVKLGGQSKFVLEHGFSDDALAVALGLGEWLEEGRIFDATSVKAALRAALADAERHPVYDIPAVLAENLKRLAAMIGLSQIDCQVLALAVHLRQDRLLDEAGDMLGYLDGVRARGLLADILSVPRSEISAALSSKGKLTQSGLLSLHPANAELRSKLELLSREFAERLFTEPADAAALLRGTVHPLGPSSLTFADYAHLDNALALLRVYLRRAYETGRTGVNIFIYGPPGTGKSELARLLAQDLGIPAYEIASEDANGDPRIGAERLRAYCAAQTLFGRTPALMVFDEVEDVFDDGGGIPGRRSTARTRKAWINRNLESNRAPTLWLSNSVRCLDAAFVRRFDMVLEVPVPGRAQRLKLVRTACQGLPVGAETLERVAAAEDLSPAVITRAASVVQLVRETLPEANHGAALELLVNATLEAQGHEAIAESAAALPAFYDPALVNACSDLNTLAEGLLRDRAGRLCLYGPPGTGKSAFGRWLADRLGVPLHLKNASDLLSPWLGMTEKNLAHAFREAREEGAVLMLDEVDSFLQDRRRAQRPWEVTAANEMLSQMENFPGVFVASTNLMDGLDQASLRRFDLKLHFDYLRPDQVWALLQRHCAWLGLGEPADPLRLRCNRLTCMTPGDFALLARQHRFRPFGGASDLLHALEVEIRLKPGVPKHGVGFV